MTSHSTDVMLCVCVYILRSAIRYIKHDNSIKSFRRPAAAAEIARLPDVHICLCVQAAAVCALKYLQLVFVYMKWLSLNGGMGV